MKKLIVLIVLLVTGLVLFFGLQQNNAVLDKPSEIVAVQPDLKLSVRNAKTKAGIIRETREGYLLGIGPLQGSDVALATNYMNKHVDRTLVSISVDDAGFDVIAIDVRTGKMFNLNDALRELLKKKENR